jgi:hypothetical protein
VCVRACMHACLRVRVRVRVRARLRESRLVPRRQAVSPPHPQRHSRVRPWQEYKQLMMEGRVAPEGSEAREKWLAAVKQKQQEVCLGRKRERERERLCEGRSVSTLGLE